MTSWHVSIWYSQLPLDFSYDFIEWVLSSKYSMISFI